MTLEIFAWIWIGVALIVLILAICRLAEMLGDKVRNKQ
jgi:hypothetical protein